MEKLSKSTHSHHWFTFPAFPTFPISIPSSSAFSAPVPLLILLVLQRLSQPTPAPTMRENSGQNLKKCVCVCWWLFQWLNITHNISNDFPHCCDVGGPGRQDACCWWWWDGRRSWRSEVLAIVVAICHKSLSHPGLILTINPVSW